MVILPPEWEDDDDDPLPFPWGGVVMFVIIYLLGAMMEYYGWTPFW